ncbi:MAG: DUF4388 domain-containing protein [Desulfobacterales bacterium]
MKTIPANTVFSGDLNFFGLGDLLQLIGSNNATGLLNINNPYDENTGVIFFVDGNPIDARYGSLNGLDAVYALFGWTRGHFEFVLSPVKNAKTIHDSRMQIILTGLKMLDEGKIKRLGPISYDADPENDKFPGVSQPVIRGPLIDYLYVVDEETFTEGQDIVLEGKHGNWLWVILDGTVQILRETENGPVKIVRLGSGSFVGSIASFLLGDYTRSATVIAETRVMLGVLDSQRLLNEFALLTPVLKSIFLSLDKRLKQVTESAVAHFFNTAPPVRLNKMELYLPQEDHPQKPVLIREGRASVIRSTPYGDVLLANLYPDDFIGKIPFIDMDHEHLSASVYVSKNLKVSEIDMSSWMAEYNRLSTTFKNIINNVAACMSATSMMTCEFKKKHAEDESGADARKT